MVNDVDIVDDRGYGCGRVTAMPGLSHEVLIVALREQPALLRALVTKLTEASLPRGIHPVDAAVRFVKTAEVRMDLVLQNHSKERVIVELQRAVDLAKSRRWLLATSLLFDQTGTLGDLIVITASRAVGRGAARVAQVQTPLGTKLALTPVVLVLGPEQVEALLDPRQPELALFAAWAMQHRHGSKAHAVVKQAIELTGHLPPALQRPQMDAIRFCTDRVNARRAPKDPHEHQQIPGERCVAPISRVHERAGPLRRKAWCADHPPRSAWPVDLASRAARNRELLRSGRARAMDRSWSDRVVDGGPDSSRTNGRRATHATAASSDSASDDPPQACSRDQAVAPAPIAPRARSYGSGNAPPPHGTSTKNTRPISTSISRLVIRYVERGDFAVLQPSP